MRRLVRDRGARHAIDAERAQVVATVVVGGEVPAPRVHDEAVAGSDRARLRSPENER